jgi:putative transposase
MTHRAMSDNKFEIDVQAFAKALQSGQPINGKDGLLTPLIKQVTEAALAGELDQYLANDTAPNRKNGSTRKTIKTSSGQCRAGTSRYRS